MLTLDSEHLARQRRADAYLGQREGQRQALADYIAGKDITVADDGGMDTTSLAEQLGTPLSSDELLRRLRLMNPDLIYEVSVRFPDRIGIYVTERREGMLALDATITKRMIAALRIGMMPERTVRHVKTSRIPHPDEPGTLIEIEEYAGETPGWRKILARLLAERLITMPQIDRYFPANWNSRNWQLATT